MIKCTFENDHQARLRHVTVDALIIKNDQLLMVKRSADSQVEPGKYVLPGGYMERDESGEEAIKREVSEETGFPSKSAHLFMLIDKPRLKGDDRQNVGLVYIVTVDKQLKVPDDEITSLHWFSLAKPPLPSSVGFDHLDIIQKYLRYLKNPQALPFVNFHPAQ